MILSSVSNTIYGKNYIADIHTSKGGYSLYISGEGEDGLTKFFHRNFSKNLNLISRETLVLLHLSTPVEGENFKLNQSDYLRLPETEIQPVAKSAAERSFATLMNSKKNKMVNYIFDIDQDLKEKFERYCDANRYSYSDVLNLLMKLFIKKP